MMSARNIATHEVCPPDSSSERARQSFVIVSGSWIKSASSIMIGFVPVVMVYQSTTSLHQRREALMRNSGP